MTRWMIGLLCAMSMVGCTEQGNMVQGISRDMPDLSIDASGDLTSRDLSVDLPPEMFGDQSGTSARLMIAPVALDGAVDRIVSVDGQVYLVGARTWRWEDEKAIDASSPSIPMKPEQLPQSRITHATNPGAPNTIISAWFALPTTRYRHGVLGDAVEASALRVEMSDGQQLEVMLDEASVFEDLVPRLVDVDGDGVDEVFVVRAYLDAGAAPVLYRVQDNQLVKLWEPDPIGIPNRWLNPVGVADLDGDGDRELAYVVRPHLDGTLTIWRWRAGRMLKVTEQSGFSNHGIGSTSLGLSTISSPLSDGTRWMIVPGSSRSTLHVVQLRQDILSTLASETLPAPMSGDLVAVGDNVWLYVDAQGRVHTVTLR